MRGAIVPHAPLLLPELESDEVAASAGLVRDAIGQLDAKDAELLVIASPHGPRVGIYRDVSGNLDAFGVPDVSVSARGHDIWSEVPGANAIALETPADHGIVVALRLLEWDLPTVALCAAESDADNPEASASASGRAAGLIKLLARERNVMVIASVNTSACLSARAPYPNDVDPEPEAKLLEIIQSDVGALKDEAAGITGATHSCALAPLLVMAHLFAGQRMEVLAHEAPVGVGYLVARTT